MDMLQKLLVLWLKKNLNPLIRFIYLYFVFLKKIFKDSFIRDTEGGFAYLIKITQLHLLSYKQTGSKRPLNPMLS